jgi:NADH-quinone oxidoreductase subunit N
MILTGTILLLVFLDLIVKCRRVLAVLASAGCIASLLATFDLYGAQPGWLFHRMIVLDNFSLFFKVVALTATLLTIWMSQLSNEISRVHPGEYYTLLLTCALGVASGTMIYGMSWVYGMAGSLDYGAIQSYLAQGQVNRAALFIAFIFILAGFGYKIVFVPFHMWSPDVYQGAPTPFTAFLSVASNAAGLAIMIRFFFPGISRMAPGRRMEFCHRRGVAARPFGREHDHDDLGKPLRLEPEEFEADARLLGDRPCGLYAHGTRRADQ